MANGNGNQGPAPPPALPALPGQAGLAGANRQQQASAIETNIRQFGEQGLRRVARELNERGLGLDRMRNVGLALQNSLGGQGAGAGAAAGQVGQALGIPFASQAGQVAGAALQAQSQAPVAGAGLGGQAAPLAQGAGPFQGPLPQLPLAQGALPPEQLDRGAALTQALRNLDPQAPQEVRAALTQALRNLDQLAAAMQPSPTASPPPIPEISSEVRERLFTSFLAAEPELKARMLGDRLSSGTQFATTAPTTPTLSGSFPVPSVGGRGVGEGENIGSIFAVGPPRPEVAPEEAEVARANAMIEEGFNEGNIEKTREGRLLLQHFSSARQTRDTAKALDDFRKERIAVDKQRAGAAEARAATAAAQFDFEKLQVPLERDHEIKKEKIRAAENRGEGRRVLEAQSRILTERLAELPLAIQFENDPERKKRLQAEFDKGERQLEELFEEFNRLPGRPAQGGAGVAPRSGLATQETLNEIASLNAELRAATAKMKGGDTRPALRNRADTLATRLQSLRNEFESLGGSAIER